jgi:hypothetical protein
MLKVIDNSLIINYTCNIKNTNNFLIQGHTPQEVIFESKDSSDSQSEAGCITWSRKQTPNDDEFSSIDSRNEFSSRSDSSSSLMSSSSSSSFSSSDSSSLSGADKPKQTGNNQFIPRSNANDTDESVIFAEENHRKSDTYTSFNPSKKNNASINTKHLEQKSSHQDDPIRKDRKKEYFYIQMVKLKKSNNYK